MNVERTFSFLLSYILFHANRSTRTIGFYEIKNKILARAGEHVGYDIQHFEGKKCWTCHNGTYYHYDWNGKICDADVCWHCNGTGWYKKESWVILKRIKYGKYTFHQPENRVFEKPDLLGFNHIEGYIDHRHSKFGRDAYFILQLLYDFKRTIKNLGIIGGYFVYWRRPYNFIHNVAGIIRRKSMRQMAFDHLTKKLRRKYFRIKTKIQYSKYTNSDDLPF